MINSVKIEFSLYLTLEPNSHMISPIILTYNANINQQPNNQLTNERK